MDDSELRDKWDALCLALDEFRDCFERHLGQPGTADPVGLYLGSHSPAPPAGALTGFGALGGDWMRGPASPGTGVPTPANASPGSPGVGASAALGALGGNVGLNAAGHAPAAPFGALTGSDGKTLGVFGKGNDWLLGTPGAGVPAPSPASPGSFGPAPGASATAGTPPPMWSSADDNTPEARDKKLTATLYAMMNNFIAETKPLIAQFAYPFTNQYQLSAQLIQLNTRAVAEYEALRADAKALADSGRKGSLQLLDALVEDAKKAAGIGNNIATQKTAVDIQTNNTLWNANDAAVKMMQDVQAGARAAVDRTFGKFKL